MRPEANCRACRYFQGSGPGECRRAPPTHAGWPRASITDWCGEFAADEEPVDETWFCADCSAPLYDAHAPARCGACGSSRVAPESTLARWLGPNWASVPPDRRPRLTCLPGKSIDEAGALRALIAAWDDNASTPSALVDALSSGEGVQACIDDFSFRTYGRLFAVHPEAASYLAGLCEAWLLNAAEDVKALWRPWRPWHEPDPNGGDNAP